MQRTRLTQKIEGEQFAFYTALDVKGFDLNLVFQSLGKLDFEAALSAASQLQDKNLRAAATIALSSDCMSQPPPKPAPVKTAAPVKQN